jgi:hypothetical protein
MFSAACEAVPLSKTGFSTVFAFDVAEIFFDDVHALKKVTIFLRVLTFSMTPVVGVHAQALVGPNTNVV